MTRKKKAKKKKSNLVKPKKRKEEKQNNKKKKKYPQLVSRPKKTSRSTPRDQGRKDLNLTNFSFSHSFQLNT